MAKDTNCIQQLAIVYESNLVEEEGNQAKNVSKRTTRAKQQDNRIRVAGGDIKREIMKNARSRFQGRGKYMQKMGKGGRDPH